MKEIKPDFLKNLRNEFPDLHFEQVGGKDQITYSANGWSWTFIKHKKEGTQIGRLICQRIKGIEYYDHIKWYKGFCGFFSYDVNQYLKQYGYIIPLVLNTWIDHGVRLDFNDLISLAQEARKVKIEELRKWRKDNPKKAKRNKKTGKWYIPGRPRIDEDWYGEFMKLTMIRIKEGVHEKQNNNS